MTITRSRRTTGAAVALVLVLFAGACSGDDDDGDDPGAGASKSSQTAPPDQDAQLVARRGKVTGKVAPKRARSAVGSVGRTVDRWFEAAWVGGRFPRRSMKGAWPGFTRDLMRRARTDKVLTTNARLAPRIEGVHVVRRVVKVDLLGAARRPVGATARFRLVFDTEGDVTRRVVVTGRLTMSPVKGTWRIFAYDVARQARAVPTPRKDS
ncbi:hypothetical protein [Nocardioides jensenii]|uniref:hypothetical protein n=1 Tax=Nocardioides jensenii TaxID=1843 RepID=UPI00083171D0|nr:hypothetical protein [Nocardioides jensenii]